MKGRKCESAIRKLFRSLEERDLARGWKWPEEKMLKVSAAQCGHCGGYNQGLILMHTERPGSDFFGYTRTGRVILIECKQTDKPRLEISDKGLKPHQYYALHDCHRAGGIALLAWMHAGVIGIFDVDMIVEFSKSMRSIPWSKLPEKFQHAPDSKDMLSPWLM